MKRGKMGDTGLEPVTSCVSSSSLAVAVVSLKALSDLILQGSPANYNTLQHPSTYNNTSGFFGLKRVARGYFPDLMFRQQASP
jgi:hypothetical protein